MKLNPNLHQLYHQLHPLINNPNLQHSHNTHNINTQHTTYTPQLKLTTPILLKPPIPAPPILLKQLTHSIFTHKIVPQHFPIKPHQQSKLIPPFNPLLSIILPTNHPLGIQSQHALHIVIHIPLNTV
ncbi:PTS glucose transporter subunit IIA, partial [Staphylococcus aureus]|uniref:PTS glucose transporter subunit IIA n=1 Tax=Staphylococcus aureus TaxID=1280 RepID=UPI0037D9CADC